MSDIRDSAPPPPADTLGRHFLGDFTPEEFRGRREKILEGLPPGSVVVVAASPHADDHSLFRQNNDFAYLCGVLSPHAYLLLDSRKGSTTLFLSHQSKTLEQREGKLPSPECADDVRKLSGIEDIRAVEELTAALEGVGRIWTPFRQAEGALQSWDTLQRAQQDVYSDPWDGREDRTRHFVGLLRKRFPAAEVQDLTPRLDALRIRKSPKEMDLLRVAGRLSALGLIEAMKCTRPGAFEYQLEAAMRYQYLVNGARDVSYRAIVGGGDNAWYGHYNANDSELRDGDLVLFDCGPEYHYYTSDITRMWPVNGKYSAVQRELYGYMLTYHMTLLDLIRPGVTDVAIQAEVKKRMVPIVEKTKFSKTFYRDAAFRSLEHPTPYTHSVGMAVHDVGSYRGNELFPGLVFALDPQLIIPEERRYIRVEDTVAVTEHGIENFTQLAPYDMDEVERVMTQKNMLREFEPWRPE